MSDTQNTPRISTEVFAWMEAGHSNFAQSLRDYYKNKLTLSDKQIAAAQSIIAASKLKPVAAPSEKAVIVDKLMAAFETAASNGVKKPVMRFEHFTASLAPKSGRNPGAIYIKVDGTYVGKIQNGELHANSACPDDTLANVREAMHDPLAAAIAYGRKTIRCSICGITLTNKESRERGIGPICATNMGL